MFDTTTQKNLFNSHTEDPGNSWRCPYSVLSKPVSSLNSGLVSGQAAFLSSSANSMNACPAPLNLHPIFILNIEDHPPVSNPILSFVSYCHEIH